MKSDKVRDTVIKSLENGSTIMAACEAADISLRTYYFWYHSDEKFKQRAKKAKESRVQVVEDALLNNALKNNTTAQIFWLANRTKGKWQDVKKIEHSGKVDVNLNKEFEALEEELEDED